MLPELLKRYTEEAEALLAQGKVGEIIFSGGTYQVQVLGKRSKEGYWTFLQLDDHGRLRDSLCTCQAAGESACVHIAAAYLRLNAGYSEPLHVRFQRSLWNVLCRHSSEVVGYASSSLAMAKKGHYRAIDENGRELFSIRGTNEVMRRQLQTLLEERRMETEETSIKFSNLPEGEISRWREGRPSPQLLYELSFWSDLAKWLLLMQEGGNPLEISFDYGERGLPKVIHVRFRGLDLLFALDTSKLSEIIPALGTVRSPLVVHTSAEGAISAIAYDKKMHAFKVKSQQTALPTEYAAARISIDSWWYVPRKGFFAKEKHPLLDHGVYGPQEVSDLLNEHGKVISSYLQGDVIHREPVRESYILKFDDRWNLHVRMYLFQPGDLQVGDSFDFGEWVYLDGKGFYHVPEREFSKDISTVPVGRVSDLVSGHRGWFNSQPGFRTHLTNVQNQLTYAVDEQGTVSFSSRLLEMEESAQSKDFGSWVYMEGEGFYSKGGLLPTTSLRAGLEIAAYEVPVFIRMHRDELEPVPRFFNPICPVVKASLTIELDGHERVVVTPTYELDPRYKMKDVRFYDDIVYVKGAGFHELPASCRLPERFRQKVRIGIKGLPLFLAYEFDGLKEYATSIDPRICPPTSMALVAKDLLDTSDGYRVQLFYRSEKGDVPVSELWEAMHHKRRFLFSQAGRIDLDEQRLQWIRHIAASRVDKDAKQITLSSLELIRLHSLDPIRADQTDTSGHVSAFFDDFMHFRTVESPDLTGCKSSLRPYQETGLGWLWFLYRHNLSGLLCDDMGLGKTHQAMALMSAVGNHLKRMSKRAKFLVICPTSVIYHWEEKLQQYLPDLKVHTFHGSGRVLEPFQQGYDVLLTSYGIWRIEREQLSTIPFDIAVFDEIQVAKNRSSRIHSALQGVKAKMRVGLTGTPIENHLVELKSLFDLVVPSYMPGEVAYRDFFVKPIEEGDQARRQLLTNFIKPFVLRRKKDDVLTDLPEKSEEVAHCSLLPQQADLYKAVLQQMKGKLLDDLRDESLPVPYIHVFALLTILKQICNHPAVYLKDIEHYQKYESGKWDLFVELLTEARESEQKVVVFSQYLGMLDIMEIYLRQQQIGYAMVRGSTINRAEQIQRFNRDPTCQVFLGSLQAVGLGVDLTAASVVIHYDRWWNAARENQATDRVHRIGQTRGVQVFKLVTKGTFEERIDALIAKKGKLIDEVVGADDQHVVKQLTRSELLELLKEGSS